MTTEPVALLIEDDPAWRDIIQRKLGQYPCFVEVAENLGQVDIKFLMGKLSKYSLVILDLTLDTTLGIKAGLDILQNIVEHHTDVPVIIISGYENREELIEKLKPFSQVIVDRLFFKDSFELASFDRLLGNLLGVGKTGQRGEPNWQNLQAKLVYAFCFLKIDIKGHSRLLDSYNTIEASDTLDSFEEFVELKVDARHGQIWGWQGDGGLCAFIIGDSVNDAVSCANDILDNLPQFNADRTKNKIREEIRVRIAVHYGTARYRYEKGRIHSPAINFVAHLEAKKGKINSVCISNDVWKELPDRFRSKFEKDPENFESKEIFHYKSS